jgi:hypothetical protein
MLKSKTLSRKAKPNVCKTIIRPLVINGSETWTLAKKKIWVRDHIWERKVLRRIFGPVNDRGMWRIRSSKELADIYEETDLATVIKTLWLRWLGHICRM